MQTINASPANPYLVFFDQIILKPFTGGSGKFELVERNWNDVDVYGVTGNFISGGESKVTIATHSGFSNGLVNNNWSHLVKVITSDKTYSVNFVPGIDGDGVYSMRVQKLN